MKHTRIQLTILILMMGMESLYCKGNRSPRCEECSELTETCRRCKPGWWGSICNRRCFDDNCHLDTCEIHSGQCTYGCKDGWYLHDNTCLPCQSNCLRCLNKDHCIVCKDAKYGDTCKYDCEYPCAQCEQTYSDRAYGASFHRTCLKCVDGMYGTRLGCYYECSSCIDNACSRDNCTYGCKDGLYNFGSRLCVRCFPGCASCNGLSFRDKACLTCKPGKWGHVCDKDCSHLCPQKICNQTTGECLCEDGYYLSTKGSCEKCPPSCLTCLSEESCTSCYEGTFGNRCEKSCPGNCLECSVDGLSCKSCRSDHYMRNDRCYPCDIGCTSCWWMKNSKELECTRCKDGFYRDIMRGRFITKCYSCPSGCSTCNRTGECQSCMPEFHLFHRKCCPNNCVSCTTDEKCTECVSGYFGSTCDKKCVETCQKCYSQDECDSCKIGYYSNSQNGEYTCNCVLDECSERSDNGTCRSCKQVGWYAYGEGCCPCNKCKNNYCNKKGKCLDGCPSVGKFGTYCNLDCSQAIKGCKECVGEDFSTVQCLECLPSTYLTANSCQTCSSNCLGMKCKSDGSCSSGCINGWFGQFCDFECDERCINYLQNLSKFYKKLASLFTGMLKYL